MKKVLKYGLLGLLIILFIGTFVFLYQKSSSKEKTFHIYTVGTENITKTSLLTGTIEPKDEILIKPQISGIISEVYKKAGETVKRGDIIAKVKVIPDMAQLNSAENRLALAQINYTQAENEFKRTQKLMQDELISKEEYEKGKQLYLQSKEELSTAKDALQIIKDGVSSKNTGYSTTLIRSTIDGLILDIPVKVGNSVIMSNTFNDGTTIASVADMSKLMFKGFVDETEVGKTKIGMSVNITVGALDNKSFPAIIDYIAPKVKASQDGANQFELRASVAIPSTYTIRAGYSANAEIILEQLNNVLAIPEALIEYSNEKPYVYKVVTENPQTFKRTPITTGLSDGVNIEVKAGLKLGDKLRGYAITSIEENN